MAQEYVTELNVVVSQLTTSSARRKRKFLAGRLAQVRQDLETAEKDFSQFASNNAAIDIKEQGERCWEQQQHCKANSLPPNRNLASKQIYVDKDRVRSW